jgi:hypothetical protein
MTEIKTHTKRRGQRKVSALCSDCGWESQAPNAQGNAARHAAAHGHEVCCEVYNVTIYTGVVIK